MHFGRHVEGRQAHQRNVSWEYSSASQNMPAPDRRQNLSIPRLPMRMIADTLAPERGVAGQKDPRMEGRLHSRSDSSGQVFILQVSLSNHQESSRANFSISSSFPGSVTPSDSIMRSSTNSKNYRSAFWTSSCRICKPPFAYPSNMRSRSSKRPKPKMAKSLVLMTEIMLTRASCPAPLNTLQGIGSELCSNAVRVFFA